MRLAVLIDADNAQAAVIEAILAEVATYGEATVKRIYGDFTSSHSSSWKKVLQRLAIKPMQQFAYTTGKNATDSALIIDAMDLLHTKKFEGFCLVTSDSDFTGLAVRLREEGLTVLGFGEKKTPDAFRFACHKFIFTELLRTVPAQDVAVVLQTDPVQDVAITPQLAPAQEVPTAPQSESAQTQNDESAASATPLQLSVFPKDFVVSALEQSSDESGWAHLGTFGSFLTKLQPDFDSRLYGFKKLSDLVKAKPELFEVVERTAANGVNKNLYVRAK